MTTDIRTESCYLYDALSFTSKCDSKDDIISLLGLDNGSVAWEVCPGAKGYIHRLYFMGISIHYDSENPDQNVWCEMSGQGCRAFESFGNGDYDEVFRWLSDEPKDRHLTRLDVAFDDHDDYISLDKMWYALEDHNYVSKSKWSREDDSDGGRTIYLGSKHSEMFFRVYDKAVERGFYDRHWVRLELQLRRDYATKFVSLPGSIGDKRLGVLSNQWRFIQPSGADTNKRRAPSADWWVYLLNGIGKVKLFAKPEIEYNLSSLERYVFDMAGQASLALLSVVGLESYLMHLNDTSYKMVNNPKYRRILELYGDREAT